jgi:hypothetical protein
MNPLKSKQIAQKFQARLLAGFPSVGIRAREYTNRSNNEFEPTGLANRCLRSSTQTCRLTK